MPHWVGDTSVAKWRSYQLLSYSYFLGFDHVEEMLIWTNPEKVCHVVIQLGCGCSMFLDCRKLLYNMDLPQNHLHRSDTARILKLSLAKYWMYEAWARKMNPVRVLTGREALLSEEKLFGLKGNWWSSLKYLHSVVPTIMNTKIRVPICVTTVQIIFLPKFS